VGPQDINIHDWEVCHRESWVTVLSGRPDTFDQTVYVTISAVKNQLSKNNLCKM
jgi:hypothetical protein